MKTFEDWATEKLFNKYEKIVYHIFDNEGNELVNLPLFKIEDGEYTVYFEDGSKAYIEVYGNELEAIEK